MTAQSIPTEAKPADARLAAWAMMLGNFVVGLAVLTPAGMLEALASGLSVSIRDAGLLIAFGAMMLCIGSPLMAWATSAMDRRILLTSAMVLLVVGQAASAVAPNYLTLLTIRIIMLSAAATFTPLAASTIALMVPESERSSRISFVFMGWPLALAAGLPLVAFIADHLGWRMTYGALAAFAAIPLVLLPLTLPRRLFGAALSLRSWGDVARNPRIILLLSVTTLWTAGLYVILPYLVPLLGRLAGAGAQTAAILFAVIGGTGFVGNVLATRVVGALGAPRTSLVALASMLLGVVIWTLGAGSLAMLTVAVTFWGLGIASTHSMVQARLVAAAPALASATVALNTSWLYIGQALGSWLGGELIARELPGVMGWTATAFTAAALGVLMSLRQR